MKPKWDMTHKWRDNMEKWRGNTQKWKQDKSDNKTPTDKDYVLLQVIFRQRYYAGLHTTLEDKGIEKCADISFENTFEPKYEAVWNVKPEIEFNEGGHRPVKIKLSIVSQNSKTAVIHYCVTDLGKEGGFDFDGEQNNPAPVDADTKPVFIKVSKKKNGQPDWKKWEEYPPLVNETADLQTQVWDWDKRYKSLQKKRYND